MFSRRLRNDPDPASHRRRAHPLPLWNCYHKIGKSEKYIQSFFFYLFPKRVDRVHQLDDPFRVT